VYLDRKSSFYFASIVMIAGGRAGVVLRANTAPSIARCLPIENNKASTGRMFLRWTFAGSGGSHPEILHGQEGAARASCPIIASVPVRADIATRRSKFARLLAAAVSAQRAGDATRARTLLKDAIKQIDKERSASFTQRQQQIQPAKNKP
jgi:hypothetical protein